MLKDFIHNFFPTKLKTTTKFSILSDDSTLLINETHLNIKLIKKLDRLVVNSIINNGIIPLFTDNTVVEQQVIFNMLKTIIKNINTITKDINFMLIHYNNLLKWQGEFDVISDIYNECIELNKELILLNNTRSSLFVSLMKHSYYIYNVNNVSEDQLPQYYQEISYCNKIYLNGSISLNDTLMRVEVILNSILQYTK